MRNLSSIEPLESRRLLSGVTLVTHGYQLTSNVAPDWLDAVTADIATRGGPDASVYDLKINHTGSVPYVESFSRLSGPGVSNSASGEAVIELDWAAASGVI